jgi:hypothetical protein
VSYTDAGASIVAPCRASASATAASIGRVRSTCAAGAGRPGRAPEPATFLQANRRGPRALVTGWNRRRVLCLPLTVSRVSHIAWRRPAGASRRTRRSRPARDERGEWNFLPAGKGDPRPECRPADNRQPATEAPYARPTLRPRSGSSGFLGVPSLPPARAEALEGAGHPRRVNRARLGHTYVHRPL